MTANDMMYLVRWTVAPGRVPAGGGPEGSTCSGAEQYRDGLTAATAFNSPRRTLTGTHLNSGAENAYSVRACA